MIINDIDLGPYLVPVGGGILQTNVGTPTGQTSGFTLIYGDRTRVWPSGATRRTRKETVFIEAPTSLGANAPGTQSSLRILANQLKQLAESFLMNPVYIQWRSGNGVIVADEDDGWYILDSVVPNLENEASGWATYEITASQMAPASPALFSLAWKGSGLFSGFSAIPTLLLAYPIGSTNQPAIALTRSGAQGTIPLTILSSGSITNPAYFVRPGTIAGLFSGDVRLYDTVNTSARPVPTAGDFVNSAWVRIYGSQHNFTGDMALTNGLMLMLVQPSQSITVYAWNTQGTPSWNLIGTIEYQDNTNTTGTIRQFSIDQVGLEECRVRIIAGTSTGNYALLKLRLKRGERACSIEIFPLTQDITSASGQMLLWRLQTAAKIAYNNRAVVDLSLNAGTALTQDTIYGFGGVFGTTVNSMITGWGYEFTPLVSMPGTTSTTVQGVGDNGITQQSSLKYCFFVVPFTTIANLQAEAESGTLGTGWTNVVDAAASAGHAAQAASGTASTNADTFGTSWVPPAGQYCVAFRIRVTSAAGATAEMQAGLWDATSSAFVPLSFSTFRASQISTSYIWIMSNLRVVTDGVLTSLSTNVDSATANFTADDVGKAISGGTIPAGTTIVSRTSATRVVVSQAPTTTASGVTLVIGAPITPTATHNMQFRAVTTAALGTNWFFDEAVLLPILSATLGAGDFPGDVWSNWIFDRIQQWTRS